MDFIEESVVNYSKAKLFFFLLPGCISLLVHQFMSFLLVLFFLFLFSLLLLLVFIYLFGFFLCGGWGWFLLFNFFLSFSSNKYFMSEYIQTKIIFFLIIFLNRFDDKRSWIIIGLSDFSWKKISSLEPNTKIS